MDLLAERFGSENSSLWVMQEEDGRPSNPGGTKHIQGVVRFKTKIRPTSLGLPRSIHWESSRSLKRSCAYCSDPAKRIPGGRLVCFGFKPPVPLSKVTYDALRPWQKVIADRYEEPEDPVFGREIHWYWEPTGNVGKTILAKYFVDQKGAIVVGGKGADMRHAIAEYVTKHEEGPTMVVINLPRCVDHVSWEGIENVKDGLFFSGKYESGMCRFNSPHIVMFGNAEPPYEKLSGDRWVVRRIE